MRQSVAPAEPVQYYFTLAQQPGAVQVQGAQQAQQPGTQTPTTIQPGQIIITQPQQGQVTPAKRGEDKRKNTVTSSTLVAVGSGFWNRTLLEC